MIESSWTYYAILGFSILYPLAQSFEKRVYMHRKFRFIFPGVVSIGLIYIVWDIWFTRLGIWGFNPNYTRDLRLAGLPLEEWLFFLIIPYCCIFLFEVLRFFVKRFYYPRFARISLLVLLTIFLILIPFTYERIYTLAALSFTSLMLLIQLILKSYKSWLSGFFLTYLVSLIPFLIVNGVLTALPVVWYNNAENLGIRIHTIPVEDLVYLMGLLLPAISIYRFLLQRFASADLVERMDLTSTTGF